MREIFELPQMGTLFLVYAFYQYGDGLVLFVCKDEAGRLYLCSCCRLGENWVVAQVTKDGLQALADNEVTIRSLFEKPSESALFVTWNGEQFSVSLEVPVDALPRAGAKLDLKFGGELL